MDWFQKLSTRKLIILLFLVGFLVYLPSLPNGFVWDDEEQVVNNTLIRSLANFGQIFQGSTFQTGGTGSLSGMYYKPLMSLSFMFNYSLWRLRPFGYHLFQLLFHLANSLLVFLLFKKIFEKTKLKKSLVLAFFSALIFVVHPGSVEAVVYVSAVQDVLAAFFAILALNLLFSSFKKPEIKILVLASLILLSLLAKESGIVAIPIGMILTFFFLKKESKNWFAGSFLALLSYSFLRFVLAQVPVATSPVIPIVKASFGERLLTIPYELFSYLRVFFFPKDLFISQHTVIRSIADYRFWLYLLVVTVVLGFLILIGWRKKSKTFFFFLLWYCFSISLVINLFPLDMTLAERWLYLPMIGLIGMTVLMANWLAEKWTKVRQVAPLIVGVILALLILRTVMRNHDWRTGFQLYSHDLQLTPHSFDLQNNLGVEYFRQGDPEKAAFHFERSIDLAPDWWTPYNNLGVIYENRGDLKKARELYEQAIENGNYYLAHENLAKLVLREEEPQQAVEIIQRSAAILPYNPQILTALAIAYSQNNQYSEAEQVARRLFSLNPSPQNRRLLETIVSQQPIKL